MIVLRCLLAVLLGSILGLLCATVAVTIGAILVSLTVGVFWLVTNAVAETYRNPQGMPAKTALGILLVSIATIVRVYGVGMLSYLVAFTILAFFSVTAGDFDTDESQSRRFSYPTQTEP